jgi:enamine deaminase RidA (YjgF/YER057c/UK114 family)
MSALPIIATPSLTLQRLSAAQWAAAQANAAPLGALSYGGNDAPGAATVHARLLVDCAAPIDAWLSDGAQHEGRCGHVRWRHNGHWLFGAVEFDEAVEGQGLQSLAERAYRDIFATLRSTGCTQLQRIWNYLPGINADGGGLERYRQFNAGRQQAFLDAGYAAFEGAPAACGIGTRGGPFCVRFLAGRSAPLAVENPRQVSAYHYPSAYGPRSPTFSRAALVRSAPGELTLLISGTASIVGHTTMHAGDVVAQTRETLTNLQAVIDAAQARCSGRFALAAMESVVYVRHPEHLPVIRALFEAAVGADSRAARSAVYVEADICRADLLVEIEAHGSAPGEVRA